MTEITGIDPASQSGGLSTHTGGIMKKLFPEGITFPLIKNDKQ